MIIYLASKFGAEIAKRFDLPPVLGELLAGVIVGISAMHLIIFPDSGDAAVAIAFCVNDQSLLSELAPLKKSRSHRAYCHKWYCH